MCAKVSEILSAREDDYDLYFELVTPQELNQSVHKDLEAFINATRETQKDTELSENIIIVDEKILERRYNDAFNLKIPCINYEFRLEEGKYIYTKINGTKIVTAILKLRDCIKIPGIQDGSLFRKNIRQSLGKTVKVNREIARTLRNYPGDFFLLHNGITAICSRIEFPSHNVMLAEDISVVNGCQSLTTIYNNSEAIRRAIEEGYIMFKFYEISSTERIDKITTSTNSQNTVKARDLRSNDEIVLKLKEEYERTYPEGQLITKRGEKPAHNKNKKYVTDLSLLSKLLISWHAQKPSATHAENTIFRTYFDSIFRSDYTPEKIYALNEIYNACWELWKPSEDKSPINKALLKHKAHGIFLHVFAVSVFITLLHKNYSNNGSLLSVVPKPDDVVRLTEGKETLKKIVEASAVCVDMAFFSTEKDVNDSNGVFEAVRWPKSNRAEEAIRKIIESRLRPFSSGEQEFISNLRKELNMSEENFEKVWVL